jgi:hypothetical protein
VITTSAPRPPGILVGRGDGVIGVHQSRCGGEALGIQVDQDDGGGPARPREPNVEAADRPGADDDDGVALADAGQLLTVEDAGERLGE